MPFSTRTQLACAWAGPAAIATFFVGFAIAGFFPPHNPSAGALEIQRIYASHTNQIRIGTIIMVASSGVVAPFGAVVAIHMRRIEGRDAPVLSLTQFGAGATGIMMFLTEAMFWSIAAYRPERSAEATQTLNDIAWFFTVMPFCLIVVQAICVGTVILASDPDQDVFPRWLGYFNLWCALLYIPGGTMTLFHQGPLAWNGIFAFWVPAIVYCTWFVTMAVQITRTLQRAQRCQMSAGG